MRDYAIISPKFWIGETGRELRRLGPEVQVAALYLLSAPGANMLGLYYLPVPTLCHETGLSLEGATKALRSLSEGGFAHYDEVSETVWVPEMARFQVGESLSPKDNRHKAVLRELESHRKCKFYADFHEKYKARFNLPEPSPFEAPSKPGSGSGTGTGDKDTPHTPRKAGGRRGRLGPGGETHEVRNASQALQDRRRERFAVPAVLGRVPEARETGQRR